MIGFGCLFFRAVPNLCFRASQSRFGRPLRVHILSFPNGTIKMRTIDRITVAGTITAPLAFEIDDLNLKRAVDHKQWYGIGTQSTQNW